MNKFLACQIVALVSLSFSNPAAAYFDQFALWSPFSLYPPGCTTFVVMYPGDSHVHARTEKIFSGSIPLWDTSRSIQLDVEFEIYRVGCTEPDRSIILVELNVPVTDDGIQSLVPVPHVFGQVDEIAYPLRLAREHRSYMRINEVLSESDTALFYLDNWAYAVLEMDENSYPGPMEPSQYNEKFGLIFVDSMTWNGDPVGPEPASGAQPSLEWQSLRGMGHSRYVRSGHRGFDQ